jgi:hypothetical protein
MPFPPPATSSRLQRMLPQIILRPGRPGRYSLFSSSSASCTNGCGGGPIVAWRPVGGRGMGTERTYRRRSDGSHGPLGGTLEESRDRRLDRIELQLGIGPGPVTFRAPALRPQAAQAPSATRPAGPRRGHGTDIRHLHRRMSWHCLALPVEILSVRTVAVTRGLGSDSALPGSESFSRCVSYCNSAALLSRGSHVDGFHLAWPPGSRPPAGPVSCATGCASWTLLNQFRRRCRALAAALAGLALLPSVTFWTAIVFGIAPPWVPPAPAARSAGPIWSCVVLHRKS